MKKDSILRNILLGYFIIISLCSFTMTEDADPTGYSRDNLDEFLNGILSGTMIGIDMDDFDQKDINYEELSEKVETLIENYQSEDEAQVQEFLKGLAEILEVLDTQTEQNELEGPTVDLLAKMSVPLLASGDITFTFKTSLIVHDASVSEYFYRGEDVDLNKLFKLGERLGNLAAKIYYDGKYDMEVLYPEVANNMRQLEGRESFTKKDYSMFKGRSIFDIRKNFFGMDNPNHKKDLLVGKKLGVKIIQKESNKSLRYLDGTIPSSYDFRTKYPKCVLPVRNQGSCGSCWAQSDAGIIEKRICRLTYPEINERLSPQHLVNCSSQDKGCRGGTLYGGWNHLQSNGITTEKCTPYTGRDDTCLNTCADNSPFKPIKTVAGSLTLIRNDVDKIKEAIINSGPVQDTFVKIYQDFLNYGNGIYKSDQNKFLGYHAMQIIGWGDDYWIIENSWGTNWGENGHVRIAFGEVGVTDYVVYATPIIQKENIECPNNCKICIQNGICQSEGCEPGFRNEGGQCVECPKNCKTCTGNTCPPNECNDGFKSDANENCVPCSENCEKCNSNGCTVCKKGFIPNPNGVCVKCPAYCRVCTSTTCPNDQCFDGYAPDNNGVCTACSENCEKCNTKGCTFCKKGFVPNPNGICVKCPANCKVCTSYECPNDQCNYAFFNSQGKCSSCPENCFKCSEKGCDMEGCMKGYKYDSGKCVPCDTNCLKCSSEGCQECKLGYELKDMKCVHVKCPIGCAKCEGNTCSDCDEGYSLTKNNTCVKCPANCSKCDENGKCLECNKPLHLVSGDCKNCPQNCQSCKDGKCEKCNPGLIINGKGECVKCDENCRYCTSTGCKKCNVGFWNNKGQCTKCTDNCSYCSSRGCWRCDNGFWNNKGQCMKCTENCSWCTSRGCRRCDKGFGLTNGQCKKCPDNCRYCRGDRCYICDKGFSRQNYKCFQCPENCNRCNSKGCYYWGCAYGYGYNNGQCKKCDENCAMCSSRGCRRCKPGFFVKNGKCEKCEEPCLACNARRCFKCPPGYKRSSTGCYKCPENCRSCNKRGCYSFGCEKGFGITKDYQCEKCTENCNKCNAYGCHPYSCQKGFGNDMGRPRKCEKCTENCAYCYRGRCRRCNYSYSLTSDRKQCINCGDKCAMCNNDGKCRRCQWKFYLKDGKCESCPPNCLYCREGRCYFCQRGYKRDSKTGQCVK